MLTYYSFVLGTWLLPLVPARVGLSVAGLIASLLHRLQPSKRKIVQQNVACVLNGTADTAQIERIAKLVFLNAAKNYFDIFRFARLDNKLVDKTVVTIGWNNFEAAYARNRGVIALTAHLGNIDLAGRLLASRSIETTVLAEPLQPPKLFELVKRMREDNGIAVVPVGRAGLRTVLQALRQGGLVCIAGDRDIQRAGIEVPFFCGSASLPYGTIELALRTGAAVVPAFVYRRSDDTFEVVIEKEMTFDQTGDKARDIRVNLDKIARVLERHIGSHPEQWVVFEPIFRTECPRKESGVA